MTNYHVIPYAHNGWAVRKAGSKRALKVVPSRMDAWHMACELAKRDGMVAYLHDQHGRIEKRYPKEDKDAAEPEA
jgi:hypothetical protein